MDLIICIMDIQLVTNYHIEMDIVMVIHSPIIINILEIHIRKDLKIRNMGNKLKHGIISQRVNK
jgi:uncharacterized protein YueI